MLLTAILLKQKKTTAYKVFTNELFPGFFTPFLQHQMSNIVLIEIPITLSLAIIGAILAICAIASAIAGKRNK